VSGKTHDFNRGMKTNRFSIFSRWKRWQRGVQTFKYPFKLKLIEK
jgi:hypothetical protein